MIWKKWRGCKKQGLSGRKCEAKEKFSPGGPGSGCVMKRSQKSRGIRKPKYFFSNDQKTEGKKERSWANNRKKQGIGEKKKNLERETSVLVC